MKQKRPTGTSWPEWPRYGVGIGLAVATALMLLSLLAGLPLRPSVAIGVATGIMLMLVVAVRNPLSAHPTTSRRTPQAPQRGLRAALAEVVGLTWVGAAAGLYALRDGSCWAIDDAACFPSDSMRLYLWYLLPLAALCAFVSVTLIATATFPAGAQTHLWARSFLGWIGLTVVTVAIGASLRYPVIIDGHGSPAVWPVVLGTAAAAGAISILVMVNAWLSRPDPA